MIAAGLLPASQRPVAVAGQRIGAPRTDVGIVFQNPVLLEWRTALGNVMLQAEASKLDRTAAERRAYELLDSRRPERLRAQVSATSCRAACGSGCRSVVR